MRLRTLFCSTLVCSLAVVAGQGQSRSLSTTPSDIPHLQKQGTATQLIVDGKPFLALAGELLNSSATSIEHMKSIWPKLVEAKLNTVLAGVSWNQIEPQEGKFDFSVLDGVIQGARSHNLRLVLLWFGTWKNGLSSYPPDWVKRDFERFPRAQIEGGTRPVYGAPRTQVVGSMTIELLSPLSDANRDADARAFAALMRHIKAVDGQQHTVITIQVENEVGMQGDTRDRSPLANQAYAGPVPKELMDYLQKHNDTLIPELRRVWEAAGLKTSGTWEEVFGQGRPTDEFFMAWNFARYINRVVEAGKAEYPIPMITNYPEMESRKETAPLFGGGQSGGPGADDMDVWRAGAPLIDIFGADIYVPDFVGFCAKYTQSGNPLFINETGGGRLTAARALYAFGRHDAIAFSPFAIETHLGLGNLPGLADTYDLLSLLAPLILEHQGKGMMSAVLLGPNDPPQKVKVGNYTLEAAFLGPRFLFGLEPEKDPPPSVAIFIATGPDEYYVAGNGVRVTFSPNTPGPPLAGLATVEQGTFVNGRWVPGMQLAGDETRQGMYLEVRNIIGIQRVTLYRYR